MQLPHVDGIASGIELAEIVGVVVPQCNVVVAVQVVLYESEVINEYLEDAFPEPPMLPQQHLLRAKVSVTKRFGCHMQ